MLSKGLFFSVFNIIVIEYKVNDKYKTKNNKTDGRFIFLAIINHTSANSISRSSLMLIATRLCSVWLSGFFPCPLKKIISVIKDISVKKHDKMIK
jgi:hypothetical protein